MEDGGDILHALFQIKLLKMKGELAAFQPGHFKNIIDEMKKMPA